MNEKDSESAAFEEWLSSECPSGDVEEVQRKWESSHEYREWLDGHLVKKETVTDSQKRKAALDAIEECQQYAKDNATTIANDAASLLKSSDRAKWIYPELSKYMELRDKADKLMREVLP